MKTRKTERKCPGGTAISVEPGGTSALDPVVITSPHAPRALAILMPRREDKPHGARLCAHYRGEPEAAATKGKKAA